MEFSETSSERRMRYSFHQKTITKDFLSVKYSIQKDIFRHLGKEMLLRTVTILRWKVLLNFARNTRDSKKIYIRINTEKSSEPYLAALFRG